MRSTRLYLFAISLVLCVAGCGQDRSNPTPASASSAPDSAASPSTATPSAASDDSASQGRAATRGRTTTGPSALRVLVLGNSIAAGYGLDDPDLAFPALLQQKADSLGWNVQVQNAGESGMTTAGGRSRIGWLLQQEVDVLVLELGGNDGLRGVDPSATRDNLSAIIDSTLARYPDARVLLAGMQIPPNLGPEYTEQFRSVYPEVARAYDRVTLIPFVLEGVGGVDRFMQSDGIHPNAQGQRRVARTVWDQLKPILAEMRKAEA
jgi:acyl-CoA thioesterase-1